MKYKPGKNPNSRNGFKKGTKASTGREAPWAKPPSRLGTKMPESAKEKIRQFNLKTGKKPPLTPSGKNHPNWKGGEETLLSRRSIYEAKRRASKLGNGGSHSVGEWETLQAQYNWTCPCCKKIEPEIKLTQDHIVPLSRGGSDNIENIQPLCKSCNSRKKVKDTKYEI